MICNEVRENLKAKVFMMFTLARAHTHIHTYAHAHTHTASR